MANILTLNVGSSSIKFALFKGNKKHLYGQVQDIGSSTSHIRVKGEQSFEKSCAIDSHEIALKKLMNVLKTCMQEEVHCIGHRIVFGGSSFTRPTLVDDKVFKELNHLSSYAPLHMPIELDVLHIMRKTFPSLKQVACFDTCFHLDLPLISKMLPITRTFYEEGIHRYGFHGLSYEYLVSKLPKDARIIAAHLGSGASLCAIKNGQSIDTTMGLTPTGGIMMGTRSGDLDPGVILYLMKEKKYSLPDLVHLFNFESGLLGVSVCSSSMQTLLEEANSNSHAYQAIEMFCYKIAKQIASYLVTLGGLDILCFSAGIGERSPIIREKICAYLKPLGITIDKEANDQSNEIFSHKSSKVKLYRIQTDEESIIASHCRHFLN